MDKRNWKIVYTSYEGLEKKAIELIYREMGALILRDSGIYRIHVLACEQVATATIDRNAVLIGLYEENALIRSYIPREAIPVDGYVVKVMDNPVLPGCKLIIVTANRPVDLFYGAIDLVDDYFVKAAPADHMPIALLDEIFDFPLPDYEHASAPAIKTRTIFTWGHPITDYRNYIENLARLRFNQLIIWNDFVSLNAKDIVAYAHEYGIAVIWGYAWGWSRNCAAIDLNALQALSDQIVETYETQYRDTGADGIYFQSFTELHTDKIGNKLIAETVTDFVNAVSGRLLAKYPDLLIQFGLHASSVKDHLNFISRVDQRVEIIWEDCGAFPYNVYEWGEEAFAKAEHLTDQILFLRQAGNTGLLFKGMLTLDWCGDRFVHQTGPYIMGVSSPRLIAHDKAMLTSLWRNHQSVWMQNGETAYRMARHIHESGIPVALGIAAQLSGGIYFPEALCAEIYWSCDRPYTEILDKVSKRRSVEMV